MAKSSIMMLALLSLCLSGCNSLYYPEPIDGMTIRVHVHDDAQALWDACGKMVEACALVRKQHCDVHLPERAGFAWDHEVTHCFGRQDAPQYARH